MDRFDSLLVNITICNKQDSNLGTEFILNKFKRIIQRYPNILIYVKEYNTTNIWSTLEGYSHKFQIIFLMNPLYKYHQNLIKESENIGDTNLIIVDVQPSFKQFFTDLYVHKLKEYAKKYTNVYQIWDNHQQGNNVDKDYLYDKKPDIPNTNLYKFPNQKDIIEKRYNYDVDADFYKKILDKNTYTEVKEKENKKLLKRGDYFKTTEGTIIVYIANKHVWYHCPKKLYDLFIKLKGKEVTMVGGSDQECFLDVETTATSLGVSIKRDFGYIYSASNCPIK